LVQLSPVNWTVSNITRTRTVCVINVRDTWTPRAEAILAPDCQTGQKFYGVWQEFMASFFMRRRHATGDSWDHGAVRRGDRSR
jgi:hypothetical protein